MATQRRTSSGSTTRSTTRIEPRVGGRWYETTADGADCDWGKVLAWDPPRHAALSWQITPRFGPEPDEQRASRIDVRFVSEHPGVTRVRLVHSELERHGEEWEEMRAAPLGDGAWPGIMATYAELAGRQSRLTR